MVFAAGDQFQGTLWFYVYKGMAAGHFMNKAKYDVMVSSQPHLQHPWEGIVWFSQGRIQLTRKGRSQLLMGGWV